MNIDNAEEKINKAFDHEFTGRGARLCRWCNKVESDMRHQRTFIGRAGQPNESNAIADARRGISKPCKGGCGRYSTSGWCGASDCAVTQ